MQVSRNNNLKIPKEVDQVVKSINSQDDVMAIKEATFSLSSKKISKDRMVKEIVDIDKDLERVLKIPENANDLIVITKAKKLCAYVVAVTQKSPAKFRGVFVNRMQNYCLDVLEDLQYANFIRLDSIDNKEKREDFQKDAVVKLKMLGYISMIALESGCILRKQYKQISLQAADVINLVVAWKKSDDKRFRK